MLKHYEKANEICKADGVEIYNAGIGGRLEIFPRIPFVDAIDECKR